MGFFDRWFGPSSDGLIKFNPEVLDMALALLGSSRQSLAELASKEAIDRRVSAADADRRGRETEASALRQYEQAHARIRRERDDQLNAASMTKAEARIHGSEAYLHSEVARLMGPTAKA